MPVGDAVRDRADELGVSISDYIAGVLAREVGLPELAPMPSAPVHVQTRTDDEPEALQRRSA